MGTLRQVEVDGNPVYRLVGEHDMASAGDVEAAIAVPERAESLIVVDLSDTTYMDSTIIGMLVRQHRAYGNRFRIVARPGTQPHRILSLVGLVKALDISESVEAALAR